ncbi:MAG: LLM class flavin-dependent oxidoreductase [Chromatiales bacterium]|jgi:probable F420-dependent oxidoreductase|nr:LLM class flavin-dependent oxidoreductase [Chromatiales bacterium]
MSKLMFGTGLRSPDNVAQLAKNVESLGFDVLACGEHITFHGDTANAFISLSVAAGATESIKLMSAITLVPLYPAALLAKLGAALDVASGGRFMMGIGVGGEYPKEFEASGVPINERGARTNEALQVVRQLWEHENVSFDGRFTTLNNFTLKPLPIQKPRPPIWVAGRKDVAMRRAVRYGEGWLPYMYSPEQMAQSVATIQRMAGEEKRPLDDFTHGVYIFTTVHEDGDTAVRMAAEKLGTQYAQDFKKLVGKYAIAGTPKQCRQRLQEYVDAGARLFILSSACPPDYIDRNIELIARELVEPFR